jgi:hypothetical protein
MEKVLVRPTSAHFLSSHTHYGVPFCRFQVLNRLGWSADASVIDQNVNATRTCSGLGDHVRDIGPISHVAAAHKHTSHFTFGSRQSCRIDVADVYARTLGIKGLCDG